MNRIQGYHLKALCEKKLLVPACLVGCKSQHDVYGADSQWFYYTGR